MTEPRPDHCSDGTRLRRLRTEASLTLDQAARMLGYSVSHLSNVERGERKASNMLARGYEGLTSDSDAGRVRLYAAPESGRGRAYEIAADNFGTSLMRRRLSSGWSLAILAKKTNYSRGYLNNLELGRKTPSTAVAEACDQALHAEGDLVRRARRVLPKPTVPLPDPAAPGLAESRKLIGASEPAEVLDRCQHTLSELRSAGQKSSPHAVIPSLEERTRMVTAAATLATGGLAADLWLLAARFAEYTGWMAQETGDDGATEAWTRAAVSWARRGGDRDMACYAWERVALASLYRGEADATIALARRGLAEPGASARAKGLALRRVAQGYAIAGDYSQCFRALDHALEMIARGPDPYPGGTSWGPNTMGDGSVFVTASCLVDLGANAAAVHLFDRPYRQALENRAPRTHVRFAVRQAIALAGVGEVRQACALASDVLADLVGVNSATVRADLLRLIKIINRQRRDPAVTAVLPDLNKVARLSAACP